MIVISTFHLSTCHPISLILTSFCSTALEIISEKKLQFEFFMRAISAESKQLAGRGDQYHHGKLTEAIKYHKLNLLHQIYFKVGFVLFEEEEELLNDDCSRLSCSLSLVGHH